MGVHHHMHEISKLLLFAGGAGAVFIYAYRVAIRQWLFPVAAFTRR